MKKILARTFLSIQAKRPSAWSIAVMLGALAVTQAQAQVATMTFEGLKDFEYVENYYAGGYGNQNSGPGPDYGVSFTSNAYTSIDEDDGGTGNFGGEPSPSTAISFHQGSAYMNVAPGFTDTLSFYYSNPNSASTITIHSGKNGTGKVLAVLELPQTPYQEAMDPTGNLGPFVYASISFSGIAQSVDFVSLADSAYVDNVSITPVPEPETWTLFALGTGLMLMAAKRCRRM